MELWAAKVLAACVVLVLAGIFGLLPVTLRRSLKVGTNGHSEYIGTIFAYLNCCAGGVFLGTAFLHQLPDTREIFTRLLDKIHFKPDFATAEFVTGVGFFLILCLEHSVARLFSKKSSHHKQGHAPQNRRAGNNADEHTDERTPLGNSLETQRNYGASESENMTGNSGTSNNYLHREHRRKDTHREDDSNPVGVKDSQNTNKEAVCVLEDVHSPKLHTLRSLVLLFALSLHTLFEGLAIGLEDTNPAVWELLTAISIHKSVISLSLGLQLLRSGAGVRVTGLSVMIFAVICPVGVGIGTAITSAGESTIGSLAAQAILQGVSTGTFFYVTFFEVLNRELGENHDWLRVLFAVLGYGLISLLYMIAPG